MAREDPSSYLEESINITAPLKNPPNIPPASADAPPNAQPSLTVEQAKQLKVNKIKQQLKILGLKTTGKKKEDVPLHLIAAFQNKTPITSTADIDNCDLCMTGPNSVLEREFKMGCSNP